MKSVEQFRRIGSATFHCFRFRVKKGLHVHVVVRKKIVPMASNETVLVGNAVSKLYYLQFISIVISNS